MESEGGGAGNSVGDTAVGEGGSSWAEGCVRSHDFSGIGDIAGDGCSSAGDEGKSCGEDFEAHLDGWLVGVCGVCDRDVYSD